MPSRVEPLSHPTKPLMPSDMKVAKTRARPAIQPINTSSARHFISPSGKAIAVAGSSPRVTSHYALCDRPVPIQPKLVNEQIRHHNQAIMDKFGYRASVSPTAGLSSPIRLAERSTSNSGMPMRPASASSTDTLRQQGQLDPWTLGANSPENHPRPDVWVVPKGLDWKAKAVSGSSETPDISPLLQDGRLTVRVIVHSLDRTIGLTRRFNMESLRASIPDGASPRTPSLDRSFSQAFIESPGSLLLPVSPFRPEEALSPGKAFHSPTSAISTSHEGQRSSHRPVPVDIHYARAHLPILASIMLYKQVKQGDKIELPVPHPDDWSDTIRYVYTGDPALLTGHVRQNILYLGGKL